MIKQELTAQLRQRQYALGQLEKELVDSITDDQIIDSYITCNCCDRRQVEGDELADAIVKANDAEHFFRLCNAMHINRRAAQLHFTKTVKK